MGKIVFSRAADDNIEAIADYIGDNNNEASLKFVKAAYATVEMLSEMPGMGFKRKFRRGKARDVRSFRVRGYENYLIFYSPIADGIRVIALTHGARDIDPYLATIFIPKTPNAPAHPTPTPGRGRG